MATVSNAVANSEHMFSFDIDYRLDLLASDTSRLREIKTLIDDQRIVVLARCFRESDVLAYRQAIYQWGRSEPIRPPQTTADANFHAFERGISPRQKTMHYYHAYNLNRVRELPAEVANLAMRIYEPMQQFYNAYTGHRADFTRDEFGMQLHPQAIHYPIGGGYLATHIHKHMPQEIGLIVHGALKGRDYHSGATGFDCRGDVVDMDDVCRPGDMVVFNYGQQHWVTPCDIEQQMDLDSQRGRWVFTLPYS